MPKITVSNNPERVKRNIGREKPRTGDIAVRVNNEGGVCMEKSKIPGSEKKPLHPGRPGWWQTRQQREKNIPNLEEEGSVMGQDKNLSGDRVGKAGHAKRNGQYDGIT